MHARVKDGNGPILLQRDCRRSAQLVELEVALGGLEFLIEPSGLARGAAFPLLVGIRKTVVGIVVG